MKRFWFAIVLLVVPVAARAQVTVRGTVVDKHTGNAVASAIVTVTGTTTAVVANDSGRFVLKSSSAVTSLTVTRVGYAPTVVAVTNVEAALRIEELWEGCLDAVPATPVEEGDGVAAIGEGPASG